MLPAIASESAWQIWSRCCSFWECYRW